ncbi:10320_t:CDS:1, partial [Racocetra persica]
SLQVISKLHFDEMFENIATVQNTECFVFVLTETNVDSGATVVPVAFMGAAVISATSGAAVVPATSGAHAIN